MSTAVAVTDVGRVVADVVTAGGDAVSVRSLSQRAGDRDELRRRARAVAVAVARAAAQQHADLAERHLGDLTELVEGDGAGAPRPLAARTMALAGAVPVAAGTDEVTVTVTATWMLD